MSGFIWQPKANRNGGKGAPPDQGSSASPPIPPTNTYEGDDRAFPSNAINPRFGGMTMLDWFAGQALAGMMALAANEAWTDERLAECAFDVADAMMGERENRRG